MYERPYLNQDLDANPNSGTSNILQSPKWGLGEHVCSFHLQNQDREPNSEYGIIKDFKDLKDFDDFKNKMES